MTNARDHNIQDYPNVFEKLGLKETFFQNIEGGHRVSLLSNGTVFIKFTSHMDQPDLKNTLKATNNLLDQLRSLKLPAFLIADVVELKHITLDARIYGIKWLAQNKFDKLAVFGERNKFIKYFVKIVVATVGIQHKMVYFDEADEAITYLQSSLDNSANEFKTVA